MDGQNKKYNNLEIIKKKSLSLNQILNLFEKKNIGFWISKSTIEPERLIQFKNIQRLVCFENEKLKLNYEAEKLQLSGARIYLGISGSKITILHMDFNEVKFSRMPIEVWKAIIHNLASNFEMNYPEHFDFTLNKIQHDITYVTHDIRLARQLILKNSDTGALIKGGYGPTMNFDYYNSNIQFPAPNNIAMTLSIARKSINEAKKIDKHVKSYLSKKIPEPIIPQLFDFFEQIHVAVIFSYISLESFVNSSIPPDFVYEKTNSKKIKESWPRSSIERWMSTSDKFKNIITEIYPEIGDVHLLPFWSRFCELEKLRNRITHQKYVEKLEFDRRHYKDFLNENIYDIIESAFEFIEYINDISNENTHYPFGFGPQIPLYINFTKPPNDKTTS